MTIAKHDYYGYKASFSIQAKDIAEFEEKMERMQKIAGEKEYMTPEEEQREYRLVKERWQKNER